MVEGGKGVYRRESGLISEAEITRNPWAYQCDAPGCYYTVCAKTEEGAQHIKAEHPCPHQGGTTTISWSITVTLVEQVWKKVDEDMMSLMQPGPGTDFPALKARLRAFAEVLAIFMTPHFTTADEIAREAKRRYDNRLDPEYQTAGLGQRRYEAPPGTKSYGTPAPAQSRTPRQPADITANLTEQQKESIKLFYQNKFTVEQLAKAQGVSIQVINAVLGI